MGSEKPRLLVVEDSEYDCESYRRALQDHYQLLFCNTGGEGLDKVQTYRPSVVLLDYQLPDMTGLDFLKASSSPHAAPSIVLTGQGDQYLAVQMMKTGASDYIVKDPAGHFIKLLPTKINQVLFSFHKQLEAMEVRELHDIILEMAGEGIVGIDDNGRILFANSAAERLLCLENNEWHGRYLGDFLTLNIASCLRNAATQTHFDPLSRPSTYESNFRDASGRAFPVEYTATPFYSNLLKRRGIVVVMQDISQRKQVEQSLLHMSTHDALTQLFNRDFFLQTAEHIIAQSKRTPRAFSIMFIDVDNFKSINDSFGHDFGDQLLMTIANRVKACTREGDIVARFGGDEFVLLMDDLSDRDRLRSVAEKIISSFNESIDIFGNELRVTPSIGISVYPDHGSDASKLLRAADLAMYKAKGQGRGRFDFFDEALLTTATKEATIEQSMHRAVIAEEFELFYQPQIDPEAGEVVAMEALIRWNHPLEGRLAPDLFIPIMEKTHVINTVGNWVLNQACHQLREWHDALGNTGLRIAVNVSTTQLVTSNFTQDVKGAVTGNGLMPGHLELEITETKLMDNVDTCIKALLSLRDFGVRIAVDDFGTGHASLRYLKMLPLHTLKIDRSFVDDLRDNPNDTVIIEGALVLAQKLGLNVVAEGVETLKQSVQLRRLGIRCLQGYFYQRPMSTAAATEFLCGVKGQKKH